MEYNINTMCGFAARIYRTDISFDKPKILVLMERKDVSLISR